MDSAKSALLNKAGFVYFRGKWMPRLFAKRTMAELAVCTGSEGYQMFTELTAALYGHDTANDK